MIHGIYQSESKAAAQKAYRLFQDCFTDKYPQAVTCLADQEEALFALLFSARSGFLNLNKLA